MNRLNGAVMDATDTTLEDLFEIKEFPISTLPAIPQASLGQILDYHANRLCKRIADANSDYRWTYFPSNRKHPRTPKHKPLHRKKKMLNLRKEIKKMSMEDVLGYMDGNYLLPSIKLANGNYNIIGLHDHDDDVRRIFRSVQKLNISRLCDLKVYW